MDHTHDINDLLDQKLTSIVSSSCNQKHLKKKEKVFIVVRFELRCIENKNVRNGKKLVM
jgi:hypothetical protein